MSSLASLLETRRIFVCLGCGGVGKTTTAATLALGAARAGRRALVITIDPARRLADALGVEELGNEPKEVSREHLNELGVPSQGSLSAMMLDMKRTFDDMVERFAENEAMRDRILQNRIYQHVSEALAGSAEYSAMEKVFEITQKQEFDLIVVDTPPSQHALDFLDAPNRLMEFLDSRIVKLLLHPAMSAGRFGFRIFQRGAQRVLNVIERISGVGFLQDISDFLLAFEGMSQGFQDRAREVHRLLTGPEAAFFLVAGRTTTSTRQAMSFLDRLSNSEIPLAGVIINRMRQWPGPEAPPKAIPEQGFETQASQALTSILAAGNPPNKAEAKAIALIRCAEEYASVVHADQLAAQPIEERTHAGELLLRRVPEFADDVHDLQSLARVADLLFAESPA